MIPSLMRMFTRRVVRRPPVPLRVVVLLVAVLSFGSTGFLYFELDHNPELSWGDAIWYAVVTVTTVGYGDFYPATPGGRFLVAMPLMFFGIGLLGYVLSVAASSLVEAKSKELHGMADFRFKDHLVIFNFPSLAKVERVLDELTADASFAQREVLLVDEELSELPPELSRRSVHYVRGNPSRDETLSRVSLDDASHAIVLSRTPGDPRSDDQAVAITVAIEARNPNVYTVVECVDFGTQELIKKAGCDRVVCTSRFDAHFISTEILSPGMQDVVDELTSQLTGQQMYLTRYRGDKLSVGKLAERCREQQHLLLGLRRLEAVHLNPAEDFVVESDDLVVTIGQRRPEI